MARKKIVKSTADTKKVDLVQKPTQINKTIDCTINSSYIIDSPNITNFTTAILLNGKQIDSEINNTNSKYKGIKIIQKNNKFIIYTGKHGLNSADDITSGILTIQFMEI